MTDYKKQKEVFRWFKFSFDVILILICPIVFFSVGNVRSVFTNPNIESVDILEYGIYGLFWLSVIGLYRFDRLDYWKEPKKRRLEIVVGEDSSEFEKFYYKLLLGNKNVSNSDVEDMEGEPKEEFEKAYNQINKFKDEEKVTLMSKFAFVIATFDTEHMCSFVYSLSKLMDDVKRTNNKISKSKKVKSKEKFILDFRMVDRLFVSIYEHQNGEHHFSIHHSCSDIKKQKDIIRSQMDRHLEKVGFRW